MEEEKTHWQKHKDKYYIGLIVSLGVVSTYLAVKSNNVMILGKDVNLTNSFNTSEIRVIKRGNSGNVVQCDQTGEAFMSQNQAADAMGLSRALLSRHLNGHLPNVGGYSFTKHLDGGE